MALLFLLCTLESITRYTLVPLVWWYNIQWLPFYPFKGRKLKLNTPFIQILFLQKLGKLKILVQEKQTIVYSIDSIRYNGPSSF